MTERTLRAVLWMPRRRNHDAAHERRSFLRSAVAGASGGVLLAGCATTRALFSDEPSKPREDGQPSVGEEMMQEHGVLERLLLVYDEAARRIEGGDALDVSLVSRAAGLVRAFVQDYHERAEEDFIFSPLRSAGVEVELLSPLFLQHQQGRQLTREVERLSGKDPSPALAQVLRVFASMYRPHLAREDTVVFPAFRKAAGRAHYRELGENLGERERALRESQGFDETLVHVAKIESALGVGDLAKVTPGG